MKILKTILEYVSDIHSVIKSDIPQINNNIANIYNQIIYSKNKIEELNKIQKEQNNQIEQYSNYILNKDGEFIIYHGKKYMINRIELTEDKPETEPSQLIVWCSGI